MRASLKKLSLHRALIIFFSLGLTAFIAISIVRGFSYYTLPLADRPVHPLNKDLRPSGVTGIRMGLTSAFLFGAIYLYPLRRKWKWLGRLGRTKHWLDFHIVMGLAVPVIVAIHSAFKFGGIAGMACWMMLAVVLSGIVGRYLYAQIPRRRDAAELTLGELEQMSDALARELKAQVHLPAGLHAVLQPVDRGNVARMPLLQVMWMMLALDAKRPFQLAALRRRSLTNRECLLTWGGMTASGHRQLEQSVDLIRRQSWLAARICFLERAAEVFRLWHVVHRPFSYAFLVLVTVHVAMVMWMGYFGGPRAMDTLVAFSIAIAITLFFVGRYRRRVQDAAPATDSPLAAIIVPSRACPRCGNAVSGSFCSSCGAPLSLWDFGKPVGEETSAPATQVPAQVLPVINASLCIGCKACIDACPEKGALAMAGGKAILANPALCKGHGDCVPACPTNGIVLKVGNVRQTVRVPDIDANYESNVPGLFVAGELSGVGLIKTSINDGRMVAERLTELLGRERRVIPIDSSDRPYDVIVVGAGPAGLSAALSLHEYGIRYLVLEQGEIAETIRQYPRNKFLMEEPVEMPLYGRLHIQDTTKEALLEVWESIVARTGVRIRTSEKVEGITRETAGQPFSVQTPRARYEARYVVLAIGKRGTPRKLGVPGEDLSKVLYRLIEADSYENADVAVVGGGDSALEAALALAKGGRNRVTLLHRSADFNKVRERNRTRLKETEASGLINVLRSTRVRMVRPDSLLIEGAGGESEIANQWVFVMAGGESPETFLENVGVNIVERVIAA